MPTDGKPTLDWIIVCDDVRAEVGEKISLMGLFDSIYAQTFPAVHPRLAVVASWSGAPGDFKSEIVVANPSGVAILSMGSIPMKILGAGKSARHIAIAFNVQFPTEATYQINVLLNGSPCRSIPLPVQKLGKPQ